MQDNNAIGALAEIVSVFYFQLVQHGVPVESATKLASAYITATLFSGGIQDKQIEET